MMMMKVANKGADQTSLARADPTQSFHPTQEINTAMGKVNPGTSSFCTRECV